MKILAKNKKAYFNYQILETYIAGIVLEGSEVKSVKAGQINLSDSYATIDQNQEIWLINCHIPLYKYAQIKDYNPIRSRKLLLTKKEISSLLGKLKIKGLTLLPLEVFLERGLVKIKLGLGKGKKLYDKRKIIKEKEEKRKIQRALREKSR